MTGQLIPQSRMTEPSSSQAIWGETVPLAWDEAGRPNGAHLIQQYVDGEIAIVLPEDVAEAELIYPKPEW